MILPITDTPPPCSTDEAQPNWWDTETHPHTYKRRCADCATAVRVCSGCPLRQRCYILGRKAATPPLIYAGKTFSHYGEMPSCIHCANPVSKRKGGRYDFASALCSLECRREYRAEGEPEPVDFYPDPAVVG